MPSSLPIEHEKNRVSKKVYEFDRIIILEQKQNKVIDIVSFMHNFFS